MTSPAISHPSAAEIAARHTAARAASSIAWALRSLNYRAVLDAEARAERATVRPGAAS